MIAIDDESRITNTFPVYSGYYCYDENTLKLTAQAVQKVR